jgi:SAM-dependent methyltransferase
MAPDAEPRAPHDLDPTGRFSDRAADYRRFRPDYPEAAFDAMLAGLGDSARLTVADVGAGTGIASRALARRSVRVIAIEPNAAMRAAAEPQAGIEWRDASAEATGLPGAAVDLVLCAQAYHWFRPAESLAEFRRVLRPGGRLALLWNHRDARDPLTHGYMAAIHAVNGEHPSERIAPDLLGTLATHGFTDPRLVTLPHAQELDLEGLLGRAASASYVPKDGRFETLRALLTGLHARHADGRGRVRLRYETQLYLAGRAP